MSTNSKLFSTNEIYLLVICTNMCLNEMSGWRREYGGVGCRGMLRGGQTHGVAFGRVYPKTINISAESCMTLIETCGDCEHTQE
jgi:hypothetical protein